MSNGKVKTKEEIKGVVHAIRTLHPESRIITTNGAFDVLHAGHLTSLERAKYFENPNEIPHKNYLIIGLNSDDSIKRYKSTLRPIIPQQYRAEMLSALHMVDYIVIFNEDDPRNFLSYVKPDIHIKSKEGYKGIERQVVEENGGRIELIEDVPNFSSTDIINRIKDIIMQENKVNY